MPAKEQWHYTDIWAWLKKIWSMINYKFFYTFWFAFKRFLLLNFCYNLIKCWSAWELILLNWCCLSSIFIYFTKPLTLYVILFFLNNQSSLQVKLLFTNTWEMYNSWNFCIGNLLFFSSYLTNSFCLKRLKFLNLILVFEL